jgi:hypothetical protein
VDWENMHINILIKEANNRKQDAFSRLWKYKHLLFYKILFRRKTKKTEDNYLFYKAVEKQLLDLKELSLN